MKKKYINLTTLIIFLMTLASLIVIYRPTNALAQIDAFTFFIPYPADSFDDQLAAGTTLPATDFIDQDIETIISIVASRDNTIIYYDHWEDGYEPILTSPIQPTTEVWGDGDLTNGVAPGIPTDIIAATNRVITIQEIIPLPRDSNNILYDGSDKLTAVGGNIAVSTSNWKVGTPSILYSDSWELYATERWGTSYIVPAGTDIAAALRAGFTVTLINVQAAQDGTSVTIDLNDGSPPTTVVLDEGQSFAQTSGTANSGASVQASAPVQVHIFASDPTATYEARGYTLVPRPQWSGDYIAPRSSDGNFLLYNPDTAALDVQVITETNVVSIVTIPAQSATLVPGGGSLSPATGTRFTSTDGRPFYGLAVLDAASTQDWGYSLLPFRNLTTQYLIGWAPGNCHSAGPDTAPDICPTAPAGNEFGSRLYVTAGTTTTIVVDYQNNGLMTDTFVISRNAEIPIFDPNPNFDNRDLTGAYLYSVDNTPFAIVWGQDQGANPALPSLDVGTAIVPLASINLNKSIVLLVDADNSGTATWGDTIRFDIFVTNNSDSDLTPTVIEDTIPTEITYLPGTTTVNGTPVPDSGTTPVPLDEGGLSIPLGPRQSTTISFQATINPNTSSVANSACATAPSLPQVCDTADLEVKVAAFELNKRVIDPVDGLTQNGDLVTYQITITSTGNISITTMPLVDDYDETQMSFDSATPTEDSNDPVAGTTTWNDLTTTFGPLLPNDVISVTVRMRVGNVPDSGSTAQNTACVTGAQGSDGAPLAQQCDTAEIIVPPIAAAYEFDKRLVAPANGESDAGETVTFGLIITSTGNLTITAMTLTDTVDQNYLTFLNSTPPPTSNNPGVTVWDIVGIFGEMVPKRTVSITVTYTVANPLPAGARNTTNSATVDGVQDANGNILPPQTGTATVNFPPTPTPTPSGGGNDDDDDGEPPPTGVPTATPAQGQPVAFAPPEGPAPGATPTLPVSLLPETGNREGSGGLLFGLLALAGLSLLILFVRAKLNGPSHSSEG